MATFAGDFTLDSLLVMCYRVKRFFGPVVFGPGTCAGAAVKKRGNRHTAWIHVTGTAVLAREHVRRPAPGYATAFRMDSEGFFIGYR
jgi:hypothetical protein